MKQMQERCQQETDPAPDPWLQKRQDRHVHRQQTPPALTTGVLEISAEAFQFLAKRQDTELFVTSLIELDRELEERVPAIIEISADTKRVVPQEYHKFLDVFSKEASDELPPSRAYDHRIELEKPSSELGYAPLWNQSTTELQAIKQYLVDNLHKGWIEPSQAPFSSPVLFVKKPDGSLRFCVDYRKLNMLTKKDCYPLPLIDETLARLTKAKVYTKLDIRQDFHRIRMAPDAEELTTFRTRYGSYKYRVLPFGLTNGPATYQRYMNDVLFEYLDVFCTAYLDDILIYSEDPLEHETHVKLVLERLRAAGLQADLKKCEFSVTETKYLGFIVGVGGLKVDPEKGSVVKNWLPPRTVKGVQSFLGFCNFYRRFIRNYGVISKPLTRLTHKDAEFDFNKDCTDAFEALKERLTQAPVLAHFDPELPLQVETDASDGVVAGVLSQLSQEDQEWHPIAFFSKTMAPAELNYEIHDKEMLAIVRSLKHWRAELQGNPRKVKVLSDHRALEYFMTTKQLNSRQARWAEFLAGYDFWIAYRAGSANAAADALSRREQDVGPQESIRETIRSQALLKSHQIDEHVKSELGLLAFDTSSPLAERLLGFNQYHLSLASLRKLAEANTKGYSLEGNLLLYKGRLVVPNVDTLRTDLVREAHAQPSTAHPGSRKTYELLKAQYCWKGMKDFVAQ
jgi:hypothetical protein